MAFHIPCIVRKKNTRKHYATAHVVKLHQLKNNVCSNLEFSHCQAHAYPKMHGTQTICGLKAIKACSQDINHIKVKN